MTATNSSGAMERTWEKLGDLTQVLTRLTERLDASVQTMTQASAVGQQEVEPALPRRTAPVGLQETSSTSQSSASVGPLKTKVATDASTHGSQQQPGSSSRSTTAHAEEKVNQAIDQIIQYNAKPGLSREQMWAITISGLKTATKVYQKVIQRVLEQRREEIEAHHQHYGLGVYHNTVHRKSGRTIEDVVKL